MINTYDTAWFGPSSDQLLDRLRNVRRKLSRWLPSSASLALWTHDYSQVFDAASRLEGAVKAFDVCMEKSANNAVDASELEASLSLVEKRVAEFESSVIDNATMRSE